MAYYIPFYYPDGRLAFTVPYLTYTGDFPTDELPFIGCPQSVLTAFDWKVTADNIYTIVDFDLASSKDGYTVDNSFVTDAENGLSISFWEGTPNGFRDGGYVVNGVLQQGFTYNCQIPFALNMDEFLYLIIIYFSKLDVHIIASTDPNYNLGDSDPPMTLIGLFSKTSGNANPSLKLSAVEYSYIASELATNVEELIIEPSKTYTSVGKQVQFTAKYKLKNGEIIEASSQDIDWSCQPFINVTNYGDGRFDIDKDFYSETSTIIVKAKSSVTTVTNPDGFEAEATVFVDSSGSSDPNYPSFNPGNQYFPGGNSGASGVPQGSYDNTFGPNTSGLIPGLDSSGNPTGQGGAVGNDVSLSGMYTKYLCNQSYLNLLAQFFWEDNVGIQALKLVFGNPIESIISLISYPFNLETLIPTRQQNFFFGKYDSLMPALAVTRSSFQIDWGTIRIPFYWGNFLDYSPYTKVQLYLPWGVGFVSIDPNEIMPYSENPTDYNSANYKQGSIRVVTNVEVDKGSCVHNVIGNRGLVIGSFAGICGKQIPITALDTSAKMLALIGAASGIGAAAGNAMIGAASGKYTSVTPATFSAPNGQVGVAGFNHRFNAGQMFNDMGSARTMKGGLASAAALAATPPNYPRAGTFSDATNAMGVQVPYLIISRPAQSVPTNYGHYNGYPSNIYYNSLSMVSGYTELSEIHLDNIPATVDELNELDSLLKGGVLL